MRRPRFIDPFQPAEVRRLVREFGSPLLILDCERVRVQLRKLKKALPRVDLHYALKPMPHPAVIATVLAEDAYLDLATTGEVQLARQLGIDPARCIHTHPIKRPEDIANALEFGVRLFVADNPDEIRIAPMAPNSAMAAFQTRQIDGFAMSMPWPLQPVLEGSAVVIASGSDGDPPDRSLLTPIFAQVPTCLFKIAAIVG